jgi:hypothetical protein
MAGVVDPLQWSENSLFPVTDLYEGGTDPEFVVDVVGTAKTVEKTGFFRKGEAHPRSMVGEPSRASVVSPWRMRDVQDIRVGEGFIVSGMTVPCGQG